MRGVKTYSTPKTQNARPYLKASLIVNSRETLLSSLLSPHPPPHPCTCLSWYIPAPSLFSSQRVSQAMIAANGNKRSQATGKRSGCIPRIKNKGPKGWIKWLSVFVSRGGRMLAVLGPGYFYGSITLRCDLRREYSTKREGKVSPSLALTEQCPFTSQTGLLYLHFSCLLCNVFDQKLDR